MMTESFIFDLISRMAHYVIFVVNEFTWYEQKYVSTLHAKYALSRKTNELLVVHNLRSTTSIKEAGQLFINQISSLYKGVRHQASNSLRFTADLNKGPPVHHVALCNEWSRAGAKYNNANLQFIKNFLDTHFILGSESFSLAENLEREITQVVPNFVTLENEADTRSHEHLKAQIGITFQRDLTSGHADAFKLSLNVPTGYYIQMKKRNAVNSFGENIAFDVTFDPTCNCYDVTLADGVRRIIRLDCPGVRREDVEFSMVPNGVTITVEKPKAIDETAVQSASCIYQQHGTFHRTFHFDIEQGIFELREEECTLELGVLKVSLAKVSSARKVKLSSTGASFESGSHRRAGDSGSFMAGEVES
jgi:HSP20 family molecular chaperone IbpA